MNKTQIKKYKPWFKYRHKSLNELDGIVFGHWAAIKGVTNHTSIKGIDLGCVWGGSLGAYNIYDSLPIDSKYKYIQELNSAPNVILRNYELMDLLTHCDEAIAFCYGMAEVERRMG